ncbi:MAG: response regulator [Thomasclavelia sp.]|nr:response regulator [Thomasclavelia sp.]
MNVLIIDEVKLNHLTLNEILSDYYITDCYSASKALEYISDKNYKFDCIIINMIMPEALDTISKINNMNLDVYLPIIAILVEDTYHNKMEAFTYKIYDYFVKPFKASIINERVLSAVTYHKRLEELVNGNIDLVKDLNPITGTLNYNAAKWLIDEDIAKHKSNSLFVYCKIVGMEDIYKNYDLRTGNFTLYSIARFIMSQCQKKYIVGYLGNYDFCIYLMDLNKEEDTNITVDKLIRMFVLQRGNSITDDVDIKMSYKYNNEFLDFEELLKITKESAN